VKRHRLGHIVAILTIAIALVVASCSTQKNTSGSRFWHSFNAKYNTYYNGALAYIDGSIEKEKGNKDNFTEMIPLYTVGNKGSRELGKNNFDRAIEKAQKAIHQHSIKKRPEWTKSRKKTEKDIEWLTRREYNPFLWKAWMLMGRSQFHKGAFDEAAATFSYMSRLYHTQPAIYGKARAWLAKCYVEQDWLYDAEDVIREMQRDSVDWRAVKEWDYTLTDYYIHTGQLEQAVPYLRKVIKHEMRRKQKAREWYLMGQIQAALGNRTEAFKAFKHVVRLNPPYELEFNARIAMTEVMASGQSKQMISRLKRMAASDNNKDYLDQVYYAMGNIYLAEKDTMNAINAYEKGNEKATRSGIEKGVLLLHLGDLYWAKEKYSDAKRCYGSAIGMLDKDRKDYEQLSQRSKVLDELVPFTEAVHLQDSLQELARMPEAERNAAIDRVITALKKKEKEERLKQLEANAASGQNGGMNMNINNAANENNRQQQQQQSSTSLSDGLWYFYNPMAVSQGKATFERQWGKRENADNWQRMNKTVVGEAGSNGDMPELTEAQRDSIAAVEAKQDSLTQAADSAVNDPHKREYYLAQIPFTEDQLAASNKILEDGLHHSGVIFKDKLDNLALSEKNLRRLADNYPDYEKMDDVYYHLFLLYSRKGEPTTADYYVSLLKEKYPESQWTTILNDPYFQENSKFGVHIEDSLYAATYEAFKKDRYGEVSGNVRISETRFPLGANRDKFLFIGGLSKLNNGDANGCIADMKTVVEKFPQSRISEMAGMIVNGVNAGKRLRGAKFDLEDVWTRRSAVLNDSDSIQARKFSPDRIADFKFLLVYHPDSINENKLLFEMAKFNFTHFIVRNFDIEISEIEGLHQMQLSGFRSFDEAYQYARELYNTPSVMQQIGKPHGIIISDANLQLIGTTFTYKDYEDFYAKHFSPLTVTKRYLLSEPAEVATPRERDLQEEISSKAPTKEDIDAMQNGEPTEESGFTIPAEPEAPQTTTEPQAPTGTEVQEIPQAPAGTETPNGTNVPVQETPQTPSMNDIISIDEQMPTVSTEDTYVVPDEKPANPSATDDNYIVPTEEKPTTIPENTYIVPEEKPTNVPAEDSYVVPTEEPKPAIKEQPKTEVKQEPATTPTTPSVLNQKPTPTVKETPKPTTTTVEDTGIDFNDDFGVPAPPPSNKKEQPQNFNIEDEYYDLDGF